jgi:8-oxo-dGTP pyrophosphatase MutT (NUDIX family)
MALLTKATIPVEDKKVPLVFVVYEVTLPTDAQIKLDPNSREEAFEWFTPAQAAQKLAAKCPPEFCELIAKL